MESPKDLAILGANIKDPIIRRLFKGKGKQQEVEEDLSESSPPEKGQKERESAEQGKRNSDQHQRRASR